MESKPGHIERYGVTFFVLCVAVAAWQCFMMACNLRYMGTGVQEWLSAPSAMSNAALTMSPFHGLAITLNDKFDGILLIRTVFISIANALLLLAPYWLLRRRWRWLVWIPLTLLTIWCLMQLCYCRAYDDLMPWQSLLLTDNVNSTLASTTLSLVQWQDLLILLPFVLLIVVCVLSKRGSRRTDEPRLKPFLLTICACLLAAFVGYADIGQNYEKRFLYNFSNRSYYIQNGLIPYGVMTLSQTLLVNHSLTDAERAEVERFLTQESPQYTDNSFCSVPGRNLVLIIVESLHTWPIGLEVDGREVTPVLNRILAGDSVIYAPHVLFQTSHGHSSDAHFIYNTGMVPLRDGVVAVTYGNGNYPTLAEALGDYDCREVICTPGMNWNQTATSRTYGFDTLYTREHLIADGAFKRHNNIDDAALTDFAAKLLPGLQQPFFLEMVTMTMHAPYPKDNLTSTWISSSDVLNAEARGYLECVHVTDSCIGAFIDDLRNQGLIGNTVVTIVSDHTQIYRNRIEGRTDYEFVPDDWGIPMIIAGADTTMRYEPVIGQVDVFPTLLDVMGANTYHWKGLGHSILRYPVTSAIQPRNMSVIGDSSALTPYQRKAWDIGRLLIFDKNQ